MHSFRPRMHSLPRPCIPCMALGEIAGRLEDGPPRKQERSGSFLFFLTLRPGNALPHHTLAWACGKRRAAESGVFYHVTRQPHIPSSPPQQHVGDQQLLRFRTICLCAMAVCVQNSMGTGQQQIWASPLARCGPRRMRLPRPLLTSRTRMIAAHRADRPGIQSIAFATR